MSAATAPTAPTVDVLTELKTLLQECQAVERRGIHVGERLYKLRELHSAQGNHTGKGFLQLLQQAGWVQRTAYYWLNKYEETIGERLAQPAPAVEDDPELAETEANARFTTIGLYRKRTFDELPQETAEKELLKSAEDFLEQSASIPNNLREELQSRNLLTPELDTKLTRVAQAAKQTNQPTQLQAEFHQLKPLFSGTGASLQFSETGYAIVGLTATQVEKIAKVLLRAVGVNTLQTQLAKAPNAT